MASIVRASPGDRVLRWHAGQMRRTNRCASTPSSDDEIRNASTPMSIRRVTAPVESFVCSVLKT